MHLSVALVFCFFLVNESFNQISVKQRCSSPCVCKRKVWYCSKKSLNTFPWIFSRNVFEIKLNYNNLSHFDLEKFRKVFLSLKRLDLSHNEFTDLPGVPLRHFPSLTHLNMAHNSINIDYNDGRSVPLLRNINLQVLDLSHNRIEFIEQSLVNGLPNLTHFNMNGNRILIFFSEYFQNVLKLRSISLNYNQIKTMAYTSNLTSESELNLIGNRFRFHNGLVPFENAKTLKTFRLGHPGLIYYRSTFKTLYYVETLSLRYFSQRILDKSLFSDLWRLVALEIKYGALVNAAIEEKQELRFVSFSYLPHLETFYVGKCKTLGTGIIHLRNVSNLTTIKIHKVDLRKDFRKFFHIEGKNSIKFLNLSQNMLDRVSYHDFQSFDQLEVLDLSYNRIHIIQYPNLFASFQSLKNLNLSGNLLRYLPQSFLTSSSIVHLNISYNLIKWISPMWSANLYNLKDVDLSNNYIRTISKLFSRPFSRYFVHRNWWNCTCDLLDTFSTSSLDELCQGSIEDCFKCRFPKQYFGKSLRDLVHVCQSRPKKQDFAPGNFSIILICSITGLSLLLLALAIFLVCKKLREI